MSETLNHSVDSNNKNLTENISSVETNNPRLEEMKNNPKVQDYLNRLAKPVEGWVARHKPDYKLNKIKSVTDFINTYAEGIKQEDIQLLAKESYKNYFTKWKDSDVIPTEFYKNEIKNYQWNDPLNDKALFDKYVEALTKQFNSWDFPLEWYTAIWKYKREQISKKAEYDISDMKKSIRNNKNIGEYLPDDREKEKSNKS